MKTIDIYLAKRVMRALILAFMIVVGIIMLVDFVETSRNLGADRGLSAGKILVLTLLKAPNLIEETIPFVVMFGVMGALFGLNKRSELTVLRAAGLSAWRFLVPFVGVTFLIGVLWSTVLNPLSVAALKMRSSLLVDGANQTAVTERIESEIWLREGNAYGQTVIHAAGADIVNRTLFSPTFLIFQANAAGEIEFSRRIDAEKAVLSPRAYWQIQNGIENIIGVEPMKINSVSLPTDVTLDQLGMARENRSVPHFWQIRWEIKRLADAGFSSKKLQIQYQRLLSLPIMLIAMTIIAASVSMQFTRQGGTLSLMLAGGLIGFAVYFINSIIAAFGEVGTLSVIMAVWTVPLFVLLIGTIYLSRIEDG